MRLSSLVAIGLSVVATTAVARVNPDERCQRAIANVGRVVVARSLRVLSACERAAARGTRAATCLTDRKTTRARAAVGRGTGRVVAHACGNQTLEVRGGDCAGARTPPELGACIPQSHDAVVGALAGAVLDVPGKLEARGRRCRQEIARRIPRLVLARLAALQRCKRQPPDDLAPGAECAVAISAAIAPLRSRTAGRIAARCAGAALAGARFAAPCDAASSAEGLAACVVEAAETAADDAVATEFPDAGFCGDASAAVERRIDDLLARMTVAEKVAQMHGVSLLGISRTPPDPAVGIPGLVMNDGPRGVGITLGHATAFPVAIARGATWDPDMEERVGEAIGDEARAKGAAVLLAPVVNLLRHPRWGRTQETYGEDTMHLGRMGVGFIRGAQQHVIASAKHFAANTIEDTRFSVNVSIDERTLREIYLPHFRAAVQRAHAGSVMSAYNKVNGTYCGENVHLLHDVLKTDWGFRGFVESDWTLGTRSTVPSLTAGLDIEMPSGNHYGPPLLDALAHGDASIELVDAAVRRILRAQLCFRLDTEPPAPDASRVETAAHTALALDEARKSIVLLKNDAGALPLDRTRIHTLAVVGALATTANLGDLGSSTVVPSAAVSPLDGIVAHAGGIAVVPVTSDPLAPEDTAAIAGADAAVVVVGLDHRDEGEGLITHGDRDSLVLPRGQDALVAAVATANPRTIVVLEGSGPVLMPWLGAVPAVLTAWYPGEQGGNAIADVLFGDVVPSGKLPLTFPRAEDDLPPFDDQSFQVTYGYFHGYRWLDRNGVAPLFPFGFGLSYTTFRYTNLAVAPPTVGPWGRVRVTADVTNGGAVAGDEVAELYVGYEGSRVERAVRDLKSFARVHLEPGETRQVAFDVHAVDLGFWDSAAGAFVVEPITYDVAVGPSSRDLPLTGSFAVE